MSTFRAIFIGFVVAVVVLVIGDARRGDSAVTAPNTVETTYTLPARTGSPPLTLPATNSPVTVNLAVIGGTTIGSSSAVLTYVSAAPALTWSGHCPVGTQSGGEAVGGTQTAANTTLMFLNSTQDVSLAVSTALNKITVNNLSAVPVKVVVELVY